MADLLKGYVNIRVSGGSLWRRRFGKRADLERRWTLDLANECQVLHYTAGGLSGPSLAELPEDVRRRVIVTIHDVISLVRPELMPPGMGAGVIKVLEPFAKSGVPFLVPSESTKGDLLRALRLREDLIQTVPYGCDVDFVRPPQRVIGETKARYGLLKPYILNVASFERRKNQKAIVQAYRSLPDRLRREFDLVLVGQRSGWTDEELLELIETVRGVRWLGYVPRRELPALYGGARCFVWPSMYEGFGLPILEAMRCGVPVITSRTSSLPEVAGDAAILVEPASKEAIAAAITALVEDEDLRSRYIDRGYERASHFSWDRCASDTLKAYSNFFDVETLPTAKLSARPDVGCVASVARGAKASRFIVLDSACTDFGGHYFDYSRACLFEAARRGYEPILVAHADLPLGMEPRGVRTLRVFTQDCLIQHREPVGCANAVRFFKELTAAFDELGLVGDDIVFMHHLNFVQADGWRYWVRKWTGTSAPRVGLVFRDNLRSQPPLARSLIRLHEADRRKQLCFFADSQILAREYTEKTGIEFVEVPIPGRLLDGRALQRRKHNGGRVRVVYLGDCRSEKGYLLLPYVFKRLMPRLAAGEVEAIIQSNLNVYDAGDLEPVLGARQELESISKRTGGRLRLVCTSLPSAEYDELLASADIVLIPYMPSAYGGRTSGIFVEALAFGKVVVASEWPWVAEQIRNYPCGVIMRGYSAEALYESLNDAIAHRAQYQPADHVIRTWCERNSPSGLMRALLAELERKLERPEAQGGDGALDTKRSLVDSEIVDDLLAEIDLLQDRLVQYQSERYRIFDAIYEALKKYPLAVRAARWLVATYRGLRGRRSKSRFRSLVRGKSSPVLTRLREDFGAVAAKTWLVTKRALSDRLFRLAVLAQLPNILDTSEDIGPLEAAYQVLNDLLKLEVIQRIRTSCPGRENASPLVIRFDENHRTLSLISVRPGGEAERWSGPAGGTDVAVVNLAALSKALEVGAVSKIVWDYREVGDEISISSGRRKLTVRLNYAGLAGVHRFRSLERLCCRRPGLVQQLLAVTLYEGARADGHPRHGDAALNSPLG